MTHPAPLLFSDEEIIEMAGLMGKASARGGLPDAEIQAFIRKLSRRQERECSVRAWKDLQELREAMKKWGGAFDERL